MSHKVIILGSGCAGCTAAIYAARANLNPLMIEGMQPGGQLTITSDVENYPGFPKGIQGPELMQLMKEQAVRFGTEVISADVSKVDFSNRPFKIWVADKLYEGETVIVSTGASAIWLGLENEKKLWGKGVSACATCDAFFFKDQHVVVAGGGDTAMEEATFLAKFASHVTVVHRRNELRASRIMQQRALNDPKIKFIWDSAVVDVKDVSKNKVTAVTIANLKTNAKSDLACDGLFVAIGHRPNTELFKGQLELDVKGYIAMKKLPSMETSVPGVFACGDVQDVIYRQAVTAAGTGCMAAMDAERFLTHHSLVSF
ncbi:MAG: thioredoxin-disulfide reductase [Deltaproteobacteria bacterium RIFCSPLOWO2_02_FULL_46_8]|nr:MAG: thioredoxin-disulfide reductase [Deltaproteobacteria bacterium RIFCSPLOWO2_02_FULL_46_8]